jgi:hypothetical protein
VLIRHRAPICATVLLAAVFWASICASRPSGTTTPARHRPVPPAAAEDYKVSRRMAAPYQQSFPLPRRFHQDDGSLQIIKTHLPSVAAPSSIVDSRENAVSNKVGG